MIPELVSPLDGNSNSRLKSVVEQSARIYASVAAWGLVLLSRSEMNRPAPASNDSARPIPANPPVRTEREMEAAMVLANLSNMILESSTNRLQTSTDQVKTGTNQVKTCSNCGTDKTPLWRRNAQRERVCNACGVFFRWYRTKRPISMRRDVIHTRVRGPKTPKIVA